MKNKVGLSGAIFVLLVSVVFFVYSLQYPYYSELGPGPGMLPVWLSGILIVLALTYLYSVIKGKDSAAEMPDKHAQKEMVFIIASMALYVILMPIIGFNLSSILFLFAHLRRGYKWHISLGISVFTAVCLFLLFTEGFATPLPVNIWGF